MRDELGDFLLQLLFYAQMAEEAGHFNLLGVAETLRAKLIRRHPHVFGDRVAPDSDAVLREWEQIKREEKKAAPPEDSMMASIPRSMPAMLEASRLGSKAARAGFDWPDARGLFEKLEEETAELQAELAEGDHIAAEAEMGDLLFTVVNLARHLRIDPESALRRTNAKFRARFGTMEELAGGLHGFEQLTLAEKEKLWSEAKSRERNEAVKKP